MLWFIGIVLVLLLMWSENLISFTTMVMIIIITIALGFLAFEGLAWIITFMIEYAAKNA